MKKFEDKERTTDVVKDTSPINIQTPKHWCCPRRAKNQLPRDGEWVEVDGDDS